MRHFLFVAALILSMMVAASPASATAATTTHYRFQGLSATAYFTDVDETGCVNTTVTVSGLDGRSKQDGERLTAASTAWIFMEQYDLCTDTYNMYGYGTAELLPDEFQADQQLHWARLNATINVDEYESNSVWPVQVDVVWSNTGDAATQRYHEQRKWPGYSYMTRITSTLRTGDVSGSVIHDQTNYALTPNYGRIENIKGGDLWISRN